MAFLDLILPAPPGARASAGLLAVRLVAGPAFILHGWPKIQNAFAWMPADAGIPGILQAAAALAEFGGGIAWTLGLLTPLASLGLLSTMAVAASFHIRRGDPFVGMGGAYEPALLYAAISLLFLLAGPGKFAIDELALRRPPRS